jgi:predicted class III extradiol MEMO1 family dioxygenase
MTTSAVRYPAVAGRFYTGRAEDLLREAREFTSTSKTPTETARIDAIR